MPKLSALLAGVLVLMVANLFSGVLIAPLLDIVHNLFNQSQPPLPTLEYYLVRTAALFRNPFVLIVMIAWGILLGTAHEHWQSQRKGKIAYFFLPALLSLFLFLSISLQDYAQQGWSACAQAIIRSVQFMLPFFIAWFLYKPVWTFYQAIDEKIS